MSAAPRSVGGNQRFTAAKPCPICNGSENDARGQASRCHGFLSGDGSYAHCSREEYGGSCPYNSNSQTFAHKLKGACKCGSEHGPAEPRISRNGEQLGEIDRTYEYRDASGKIVFEVVRYRNPKDFRQRRPDPKSRGGYAWDLRGVETFLYNLPALAKSPGQGVIVVEGEKDVENLSKVGLLGTCNPMGAGKWKAHHAKDLAGRSVAIIPDNDELGRTHASLVALSVHKVAKVVKIVHLEGLPPKGDVSDWLANGGTAEQLREIIAATPAWHPAKVHTPDEGDKGPGDEATRDVVDPHRFNLTDLGNAERLVSRHGADLRYCHPWKRWLVWDGRRWALDNTAAARRRARKTVRSIYTEAGEEESDDRRKALAKWATESEKRDRISAMLSLAEAEEGVPILPEMMDQDPWLFNCLNGTINLKTGDLRPHRREDMITKLCPIVYDPNATSPLWEGTLRLFFSDDQPIVDYVQLISGYAITGIVRDHIMPVAYGKGANGKSTILGTLMDVFGPDYAMKCPPDMLMAKKTDSHPTDRADLFSKRLVVAIETEGGRRLNETMVKELTGGDKIRARRMREDFWEFSPTHTLILATNHKPLIRGTDEGIWRRLRLIPFKVRVVGKEADKQMPEKLKEELSGILTWCVRGCLRWQAEGLTEPAAVTEASSDYRKEQDVIGAFLEECCVFDKRFKLRSGELYSCYKSWCETTNEFTISLKAFGMAMEDRDIEKKTSDGVWYLGIDIKNQPAF